MSVIVHVLLFGPARDAMNGASQVRVTVTELPASISVLRECMASQYPALQFVLMNAIYAFQNKLVPKSQEANVVIDNLVSEIILIPPVSGG
jgi:hypothetical protein